SVSECEHNIRRALQPIESDERVTENLGATRGSERRRDLLAADFEPAARFEMRGPERLRDARDSRGERAPFAPECLRRRDPVVATCCRTVRLPRQHGAQNVLGDAEQRWGFGRWRRLLLLLLLLLLLA